jgi:hypothetical protein
MTLKHPHCTRGAYTCCYIHTCGSSHCNCAAGAYKGTVNENENLRGSFRKHRYSFRVAVPGNCIAFLTVEDERGCLVSTPHVTVVAACKL